MIWDEWCLVYSRIRNLASIICLPVTSAYPTLRVRIGSRHLHTVNLIYRVYSHGSRINYLAVAK
uniref:Uncharacterized protein n=1 Tax=Arundo donax TaxID=35708 RepID=A0A0A9F8B1_ARUDO